MSKPYEIPQKTYIVQGMVFTLKETTPANRRLLEELTKREIEKSDKALEASRDQIIWQQKNIAFQLGDLDEDPGERPEVPPLQDEYLFYFEVFKALTEGEHDKLDFDNFNIKIAEKVRSDFLPESNPILTNLINSLS